MAVKTVNEAALLILQELYEATIEKGDQVSISTIEIAKWHGIPENLRKLALIMLSQSPLTEGHFGNDDLMLSMEGIEAYERRNSPDSLVYPLQQHIIQAQTITAGNIQQGTGNVALNLTYQEVFQKLEQEIEKSDKPESVKKKLIQKVKDFAVDLGAEVLKKVILKE